MSLDRSKLQNIRERPDGAFTARCPACAGTGGDAKGNHLIVFKDGRFACVAYPGGKEHRSEIFQLVGRGVQHRLLPPKPIEINRPKIEPSRTLMVLPVRQPRPRNDKAEPVVPPGVKPEKTSELLQRDGDQPIPDYMPSMTGYLVTCEEDLQRFFDEQI